MDNLDMSPFDFKFKEFNFHEIELQSKDTKIDDQNNISEVFKNKITEEKSESKKHHKIEMTDENIKNISKIQAAIRGMHTRNNVFLPFDFKFKEFNFDEKELQSKEEKNEKDDIKNISKIQAAIRGMYTRNNVFLPSQIRTFIDTHLVGYADNQKEDIARLLCRELNTISLEPEKYKNKTVKLGELLNAYDFALPQATKKQISRPFDLWLEMDGVSNSIKILIIPTEKYTPIGKELGSGQYKKAYRAQKFEVERSFNQEGNRNYNYTPKVLLKPHDANTASAIESGKQIQQELIHSLPGCKFAENPVSPLPNVSGDLDSEQTQRWYNSDMQNAISSNTIPLDFSLNPTTIPFTMKDRTNVLLDVVRSMEGMHEKGYVHRDIKPANILLKVDNNKEIEGYLSDFDMAQKIGNSMTKTDDYVYWDFLSRKGIVCPLTDHYSLIITLGQALIPLFWELGYAANPEFLVDLTLRNSFLSQSISYHAYMTLSQSDDPVFKTLTKLFVISENAKTGQKELVSFFNPQDLIDWIQDTMTEAKEKGRLSPENFYHLDTLIKEILVINAAATLVAEGGIQNHTLSEFLRTKPHYINKYRLDINDFPDEFCQNLYSNGYWTTTQLREEIEKLQKIIA